MDQVADEALAEKEQQALGQILSYGHDLDFGSGTLFDQMIAQVAPKVDTLTSK